MGRSEERAKLKRLRKREHAGTPAITGYDSEDVVEAEKTIKEWFKDRLSPEGEIEATSLLLAYRKVPARIEAELSSQLATWTDQPAANLVLEEWKARGWCTPDGTPRMTRMEDVHACIRWISGSLKHPIKSLVNPQPTYPEELFQQIPVDVNTFCHDPHYLGLPPLGTRQIGVLRRFFEGHKGIFQQAFSELTEDERTIMLPVINGMEGMSRADADKYLANLPDNQRIPAEKYLNRIRQIAKEQNIDLH
jgi:hypothetical protein